MSPRAVRGSFVPPKPQLQGDIPMAAAKEEAAGEGGENYGIYEKNIG